MKNNKINNFNNNQKCFNKKEDLEIYEESDHFVYLLYHIDCRALIGKANVMNRFDEWEMICHNCKCIVPLNRIKFVKIEKK